MPAWIISILLGLGKPAFVVLLRLLEVKFPGISAFIEAIIAYLNGAQNKAQAVSDLHKHCEGMFCPAELKG